MAIIQSPNAPKGTNRPHPPRKVAATEAPKEKVRTATTVEPRHKVKQSAADRRAERMKDSEMERFLRKEAAANEALIKKRREPFRGRLKKAEFDPAKHSFYWLDK